MTNDSALRVHVPGFLLLFAFVVAFVFFLVLPPDRVPRTVFFPGATDSELSGEQRLLPRSRTTEHAARVLVEELLLGPARIDHSRALPRGTRVTSLIVDGATVYVDLNETAMLDSAEVHVGVETGLDAIENTIMYNFRSIESVIVTIAGNIPFVPAYRPVGR